jgi:tRNA 2-thiouridine synthesizing protein D
MATYSLLIQHDHLHAQSVFALQFAQALLEQQQRIQHVFFYANGAYCASANIQMADDESNIAQAWQQLSQTHNIPLAVCPNSAARRGVDLSASKAFCSKHISFFFQQLSKSDKLMVF